MYPHKLKLHITGTFFGILILAMLLINIVIFVFWNQHMIQQKILLVKKTVSVWQSMRLSLEHDAGSHDVKSSLQMLCSSLGPECRQIMLSHDQQITTALESIDQWGLEALLTSAESSGKEVIRYIEKTDMPYIYTPKVLVVALPNIDSHLDCCGVAIVMDTTNTLSELWGKEKVIVVYLFFNALVLTVVGFFRMRKLVLNPIETLVGVAENYQVSESGGLFSGNPENEFGQLSRAMNNMVQRIEEDRSKLCKTVDSLAEANLQLKNAQHEIIRAERLSVAGRLSAALAHEIGNPVTIVQGYVELLEDQHLSGKERFDFCRRALSELTRIDNLVRQFLDVTRIREVKTEIIDPAQVLQDVYRLLETSFKKKNINSFISVSEEVACVVGDKELLRQVYLNCLMNAMDSVVAKHNGASGGKILASITIVDNDNGKDKKHVVIVFQDNGFGIKEDNLEYIFEPFFTTKDPGKGTGLGLAVSYRIILSMNGQIDGENVPSEGALFRVTLPGFVEDHNSRK